MLNSYQNIVMYRYFHPMQQIKGLLLFVAACLALVSCHKDTGNSSPRLVKMMSIDGNGCVIYCVYDDQGRVTSTTQCDTLESYTYYHDSIVYVLTNANVLVYKYIYTVSASGLAGGYTRIAGDGSVTSFTLTYNANNNRIRSTDNTHQNTFVNYTVQNGNTVYDSSASSVINAENYTIGRIFYANTDNTLAYKNFGKQFLGSSSANFKKAENYNTPDGQYTVIYTYELDYKNGVQKRVMKVNDSIIETRHYEYY